MGRSGARPTGWGARILEEIIGAGAVVDECACRVAVTEDDGVIVTDGFRWRKPAARILEPCLKPRQRLSNGSIGDRPPFGVLCLEERRPRGLLENGFELPGQVVAS